MSLSLRLPQGIVSTSLRVRDLDMHVLQAGDRQAPLVVLLHGFPELAFSWRKIMLPLADAGYFVVAPDVRGLGRTKSVSAPDRMITYEDDVRPYGLLNMAHDVVALVYALGYNSAAAVVGHDMGSVIAGHCAVARPDLFKSVVCMSAPFGGPPDLPFNVGASSPESKPPSPKTLAVVLNDYLQSLDPPLKHYSVYNSLPAANNDFLHPPGGLHAFLRAYYHMKSGDWPANDPHPLSSVSELSQLPQYYIMPAQSTWSDVVLPNAPSDTAVGQNEWLRDEDLAVYVEEFNRTGFQGGLNGYRASFTDEALVDQPRLFYGKKVEIPAMFIGGAKDWGVYQTPNGIAKMRSLFVRMSDEDFVLVDGAGHWVQQENADAVVHHLLRFLHSQ
ncbi:alpha/beta-hydrolase [Trametopsis cervina]|nr:alpha/beta-hydrolase [Trametopsis cervina]